MSEQRYDVLVIGAGLGGLLTAVLLAKNGKKVAVLEKNRQIGGCLQTFAFKKKVFDSCVHYVGGLSEGHTLNRIFRYAGIMDGLKLHEFNAAGVDQIAFGEEETLYPIGTRERFVESLLPHFPKEEIALKAYLKLIGKVAASFPLYGLRQGDAQEKTAYQEMELMSTLRGLTSNERLVQVLAGNSLLYAGVEGQTPFYVHALSVDGYLHSAHKIHPGSSQIAQLLWRELRKHGGEIFRHTELEYLSEKGCNIEYAQTTDGRKWFADTFISAIHPGRLCAMTDSPALRPAFRRRVNSVAASPSGVMLNIVLEPGKIPYRRENIYWHPSGEVSGVPNARGIRWPDTQALYFNEDVARPGFASTLCVLLYDAGEDLSRWMETKNITGLHGVRRDDYQDWKDAKAENILQQTFQRFPELRGNIAACNVATPLTFRDYTGVPDGAMYGSLKDVAYPNQSTFTPRTRIPNLLLTGQHLNLHGVVGVSLTALATSAELLGMEYLLREIK
jgi:all-trans-retinol 13,14-reductase